MKEEVIQVGVGPPKLPVAVADLGGCIGCTCIPFPQFPPSGPIPNCSVLGGRPTPPYLPSVLRVSPKSIERCTPLLNPTGSATES